MATLGDRLRREREARGISLEKISAQTRIGVRFLKAIEENTLDRLPGGIFNRSFVRQYARFLKIDEEQAVKDYLASPGAARDRELAAFELAPEQQPQKEEKAARQTRQKAVRKANPQKPAAAVLPASSPTPQVLAAAALLIIAVVAGVGWYLWPRSEVMQTPPATPVAATAPVAPQRSTVASETEPPSPSPIRSAPAASSTIPESSAPRSAQTGQVSSDSTVATAPTAPVTRAAIMPEAAQPGEVAEELLLQISTSSTVWLSITADGAEEWQGTMQPNQSRQVQAADSIRLTVGNAAAVQLTLNGKQIGALGREGEVRTVNLVARALQDPTPQQ